MLLAAAGHLLAAGRGRRLLVVEEPELHMHPGLFAPLASLAAELVRSGVQVLMATHSPELLARIAYEAERTGLDDILVLHMMRASSGKVVATEYRGADEVLPQLDYLAEKLHAIA
jgi:predicted ATPase